MPIFHCLPEMAHDGRCLSNIGYTGDAVFTVVFTILRQFFGLHCHGNTGSKSAPADPTNTLHLLITIDSFLSSLTHGPGPHLNSSLDVQSIRKKKKKRKTFQPAPKKYGGLAKPHLYQFMTEHVPTYRKTFKRVFYMQHASAMFKLRAALSCCWFSLAPNRSLLTIR